MITASTRVFALLGDPVEHSLSPVLQNRACAETGVDGVYVALQSGPEDLSGLVRALSLAGGGGNVTLPHKEKVVRVLDYPSESVRRTGACNTFWLKDGKVHGENTDVDGMSRALKHFLGRSADGMNVLLLGAGGAARAALVALLDDGAREVHLLNRSTERARAVSRRIGGEKVRVAENPAAVEGGRFDLVVNATRLGMNADDPPPLDLGTLGWAGGVMDLVYGARETPLVQEARTLGIQACDGGEMLVQQGAASFELWWDRSAPVEAMQAALREARGAG